MNSYVQDHTLGAAKSYMPLLVGIITWCILTVNARWGMSLPVDDATISLLAGFIASVIVYWVPNKAPSKQNTAGVKAQAAIKS